MTENVSTTCPRCFAEKSYGFFSQKTLVGYSDDFHEDSAVYTLVQGFRCISCGNYKINM